MNIALVSPLYERVPPAQYGGTERIVSYLAESLVDLGHYVTLFASGDSVTRARLISPCERPLRPSPYFEDSLAYHFVMLEEVRRRAVEFDLVHFHTDYLHYPVASQLPCKHLGTLHGRLDLPHLMPLHRAFPDIPVTSISVAQRRPMPHLNWRGVVHHGLPPNLYEFHPRAKGYLAFLGRISPEKGLPAAIEIAERSGMPLKIAAKVDVGDREYFGTVIRPLLDRSPRCEFIGEISDAEKNEFLGGAAALLFPIDWPEPFGLVMIEAMACGTPVIAFSHGSVPEVMEDGKTGFIVGDTQEAVDAVDRISTISRAGCRETFENRFTDRRMANDYEAIYHRHVMEDYQRGRRGRHYPAQGPVLRTGDVVAG